jgi:hypothetical protein
VVHRGNLDALASQSQQSFEAIGRGEFPSPFLPDAQVVQLPDRPDFLAAGDFIGANGPGFIAAARGGSRVQVVARGDSGELELLQTVPVPGSITALSAHPLIPGKYWQVVLGIHGENGRGLSAA